jgi:ribosomal protein L29
MKIQEIKKLSKDEVLKNIDKLKKDLILDFKELILKLKIHPKLDKQKKR